MEGVPAVYLGRMVSKEHFRAFVYSMDGSQKLVESWDDYEQHMESGLWFSTKEDATARIPAEKPKRSRKAVTETKLELKEEPIDDDFLPKDS